MFVYFRLTLTIKSVSENPLANVFTQIRANFPKCFYVETKSYEKPSEDVRVGSYTDEK